MLSILKRPVLTMILAASAALALLSGCNTIRGMGQDIESGGEAIEDTATDTQQSM